MSVAATQQPFIKLTHATFEPDDFADLAPQPPAFGTQASSFGGFDFDTFLSGLPRSGSSSTGGSGTGGTGSTSQTSGTTGTGATPSWIATLVDPVIKADMTAASAGGTVSETGMAQLFSDLGAELTTNKSTLSSSQLTDLKTIAANLNVGETASSYVTYITDALIDGNAANAKWTGGAASTTNLGNLAVGSTATAISELDGKWFLGTDLPSSTVMMTGYQTFSVTYSAVTSPVFGAGGPSMSDINQGYLGDCFLLVSLAEVANQDPSAIQSMITNNGNNTYGVRFYVNGNAEYVTVNDELPDGGTEFNYATNIWASLVEKAYAQIQASGVITGNSVNDGNSFSTIGNGGAPENTLEEITGAPTITDFYAGGSSWDEYVYNDALATQSSSAGLSTASVLSTLVSDLGAGYDEVLSSYTNATASNGMTTLVADHALSIYAYDSTTGDLEIRNPWGTASGQYWDTTFEVSLGTLLADGDVISVADVAGSSSSSSVVTGALVSAAAGLQANAAVTSFTIADTLANVSAAFASLATDTKLTSITFTDPGTPSLTLTAAQYTADAGVLAKIISNYALTVTGALASAAAGLQGNTHVASFTVSDSSADVSAAFSKLASDTKLASITLTNTGTPTLTLTGAQYTADASVLAKITSNYNLTITGALASAAAALQANTHVASFTISDSSTNVSAAFASLAGDTKLTSVALTDTTKPTLTLTGTQFTADAGVLAKITSNYNLTVTGALASAAATLQANSHVASFSIADTLADVSAAFTDLAGDTKLASITLTDTTKPALTLTVAQYAADAGVLALIASPYNLTVTGALIISGVAANQTTSDTSSLSPMSAAVVSDAISGQTETLTVTLSSAANGTLTNLDGGSYNAATGVYTDTGTTAAVTAALDGLVFTPTAHQVAPGQSVTTTFTIADTDTAGSTATNSTTTVVATDVAASPTVTSVAASPDAGDVTTGNTITLTVSMSKAVTVADGTPSLSLNDGGTASYTGGSGTDALTFSYMVAANQSTTALAVTGFNPNGATIQDVTGDIANFANVSATFGGPEVNMATSGAVSAAYTAILRTQPSTDLVNQTVAQIDAGQLTLAQFESGLIDGDQALYTTLPALVTIDAYYDTTPISSTLTAVAAATGSPAQVGGFYSAAYLHSLGFSDANVWTVMASQWGADPNSAFYQSYNSYGSNYSGFISAVYQREFGVAPSAANLQNLMNDVPGVENLLAGPGGAATPIQVVSGIYGYLLYIGQTTPSLTTQYAASADAFLQAAANGTVTYGPELTREFPAGTSAVAASTTGSLAQIAGTTISSSSDPAVITITSSNVLTDPGAGNHTIQFAAGTSGDTLMLHTGGVDQVSGFNPGTDVLDFSAALNEANINLKGDVAALGNYVTIVDQGANALVNFDPTHQGGGSAVAVLQGLGSTVTSLQSLVAHNAIRIA